MASILIVSSVERLQKEILTEIKSLKCPGMYVSLNKSQKSTAAFLRKGGVNTKKLFFIDCMTDAARSVGVLHIAPDRLDLLGAAINAFMADIKGKRFVLVDALATLLIYNDENKVAKFVQDITEHASETDAIVVAFSPKTKGEELLTKVFNFFDKVVKK